MAKTKFPHVYIDPKGKFYIEMSQGTDKITGKRIKIKTRTSILGKHFESIEEANIEAVRLKNEYLQNNSQANSKKKYAQFLEQDFIPYLKSEVKDITFETRESALNLLIERFGKKSLREITLHDAQNFRTWLLSKDASFSQSYASSVFGIFRRTLEYAKDMQYINNNISKKCKAIPKGKIFVNYWTKNEFEKVLATIYTEDFYEHMWFVLIWLYYITGVRLNEGTALYWNDIDFEAKQLRINHMLHIKSKNNWTREDVPKTNSGHRIISLDDQTLNILSIWKNRQEDTLGKQNFIFTYDGSPLIKSTINRNIKRYSELANVTIIQPKGLRHSNVSYLINEFNANILTISKRLGHSSPEITLKHYAHLWPNSDRELADKMTGRIQVKTALNKGFHFNGNQAVKTTVSGIVSK